MRLVLLLATVASLFAFNQELFADETSDTAAISAVYNKFASSLKSNDYGTRFDVMSPRRQLELISDIIDEHTSVNINSLPAETRSALRRNVDKYCGRSKIESIIAFSRAADTFGINSFVVKPSDESFEDSTKSDSLTTIILSPMKQRCVFEEWLAIQEQMLPTIARTSEIRIISVTGDSAHGSATYTEYDRIRPTKIVQQRTILIEFKRVDGDWLIDDLIR